MLLATEIIPINITATCKNKDWSEGFEKQMESD